jgi:hypothetical protein
MKKGDTIQITICGEENYEVYGKGFFVLMDEEGVIVMVKDILERKQTVWLPGGLGPMMNTTRLVLFEKNINIEY